MSKWMLDKEEAALVIVDFQEKLMPAMHDPSGLEDRAGRLIRGCRVLGIPCIATQQYTKGLGETVEPLKRAATAELSESIPAQEFFFVEKTTFSAMREPSFVQALEATGRRRIILAGIEAHICVQQTALHLLEAGYDVFLAADCIDSRTLANKEYGQVRLAQCGCVVSNYESLLYEMLVGAKEEGFKQISTIVK